MDKAFFFILYRHFDVCVQAHEREKERVIESEKREGERKSERERKRKKEREREREREKTMTMHSPTHMPISTSPHKCIITFMILTHKAKCTKHTYGRITDVRYHNVTFRVDKRFREDL